MPAFTTSHTRQTVTVQTDEIELAFSLDDGGLVALRYRDQPNMLGHGKPRPALDVQVGVDRTWLADQVFVRYLSHSLDERDGAIELVIVIGIGPLILYDRYRITGTLISRRISVRNVSEDEIQLRAVRLALPWVCIGDLSTCRFEAPGNSVRPAVPLEVAAAQRRDVLPRRFFAPGLRNGRALELAPTVASGLLALHNPLLNQALLCWYGGETEPAQPQIEGNDLSVTLIHEIELADRLRSEVVLNGGTQYILLLRQPWPAALSAFQHTLPLVGTPRAVEPVAWVRNAAIYEIHAAEAGGFAGLATGLDMLPRIGINTLCLLPIWPFANRSGQLWDGNWSDSGNPYAISDFELLDPTLGSADQLHQLVTAAHTHGMRVLVDLPLIGCDPESRYVQEQPDWFVRSPQGELVTSDDHQIATFDWANEQLQRYILEQASTLARTYDLDGFRAIQPRYAPPNWTPRLHPHASAGANGPQRLLAQLRQALQRQREDTVVVSLLGGPLVSSLTDAACDELPHHQFIHTAFNRMTPTELGTWLRDHAAVLPPGALRVCFVESYATRLLNPLADGLRGSPISRMLLCGMVFCGFVPQVRAGQELGDESFLRQLLEARARTPLLRSGAVSYNQVPCDHPHVFVVLRGADNNWLLGLLNVGPHKRVVTFNLPVALLGLDEGNYALLDLLQGAWWNERGRQVWPRDELAALRLTLEPFGAYCLQLQPVSEATLQDEQPLNQAAIGDNLSIEPAAQELVVALEQGLRMQG